MKRVVKMFVMYLIVCSVVIMLALTGNRVVTVMQETATLTGRKYVIIDAGHGGIDGGATSCTGVLESQLNLEIALQLNDLMHLLGIHTLMTRTDDRSIYTQGETIAAKKISDLKERVRIVNDIENAVLISIHQNTFPESRYHGPQVFYATSENSESFAKTMQFALNVTLAPDSNRSAKKAHGIYLLENIDTTGILIECGFISNPEEESKLRNPEYQKLLSCVIASAASTYLRDHNT